MSENNNFDIEKEASAEGVKPEKTFNLGKEIFEWVYTIVIALAIAFIIKGFLFDLVKVDGESMMPNLQDGNRLIVRRIGYEPKQGDIIILDSHYKARNNYYDSMQEKYSSIKKMFNYFSLPSDLKTRYYVKRVIGMPGQTVDLKDGLVYVDGEVLDEPYYKGETYSTDPTVEYPITVEEGHVFVMGDNRNNSSDSRRSELGQVPYEAIMGKAFFRILPLNEIGTL